MEGERENAKWIEIEIDEIERAERERVGARLRKSWAPASPRQQNALNPLSRRRASAAADCPL